MGHPLATKRMSDYMSLGPTQGKEATGAGIGSQYQGTSLRASGKAAESLGIMIKLTQGGKKISGVFTARQFTD